MRSALLPKTTRRGADQTGSQPDSMRLGRFRPEPISSNCCFLRRDLSAVGWRKETSVCGSVEFKELQTVGWRCS